MVEDKKDIANQELESVFSSNMMSYIPTILTSASSDLNPIPGMETALDESGSVVNNNVNVNLNVSGNVQNSINNYSKLNNEISKFLNVENITDPLDLKKNYQQNLKIENTNILSNPISNYNLTNYNSNIVNDSPNLNVIDSNLTAVSSPIAQVPAALSMFASPAAYVSNVSSSNFILDQGQPTIDSLPSIENTTNTQNIFNNFSNTSTQGTLIENNDQNVQNNSFQINPGKEYQTINNDTFYSNRVENNFNSMTNNSISNQSNTVSMGSSSQQQFFGNYSNIIIENRATYKPLERMDVNPNPVFSNGEREIDGRIDSREKMHSIESRVQELEKVEFESRNLNNENINSANSFGSAFESITNETNIFDQMSTTTKPKTTSNINDRSMKENSIGVLFNKMNSPPTWRTVLG